MSHPPVSVPDPLRVVVAGAGVGGLEALVALRALAGDRVAPLLVAPEAAFSLRALGVFEPFGLGRPQEYPLADITADLGVACRRDTVAAVDRARREVRLRSGDRLSYDVLLLSVGAVAYPAFDNGVCFDRAREAEQFDELLADARAGLARDIAVVVPRGAWPLPGYEIALLLAAFGRMVSAGGMAAERAAAAERIAWRAGADHRPRPYAPALRALLRTEHGPRYLRAEPPGGAGECVVSDRPLWWPPSKIAARWLTPWLASRELSGRPLPPPRVLPSGGISRGSLLGL